MDEFKRISELVQEVLPLFLEFKEKRNTMNANLPIKHPIRDMILRTDEEAERFRNAKQYTQEQVQQLI